MGGGGDSPGNRSKARYSPIPGKPAFFLSTYPSMFISLYVIFSPGDITFVVPVELLAKATFAVSPTAAFPHTRLKYAYVNLFYFHSYQVDASGKFIQVQYPDNIQPAWPSPCVHLDRSVVLLAFILYVNHM